MKKRGEFLFYIVTIILIISGFLIPFMGDLMIFKMIHKMSAVVFCILLIRHVTRYRKLIRKEREEDVS